MKNVDTIIVGGGPAGAACAAQLRKNGRDVLILDKQTFPRPKICAGWITPQVLNLLDFRADDYPFLIRRFNRLHFHVFGIRIPVRTRQYAIRRFEFDHWMLSRANVPVITHKVKNIETKQGSYIIDRHYQCRYLVGAGGTHCPVYKALFAPKIKRPAKALITAVEKEYRTDVTEDACHLWYFENQLPGYAWFVPKGDGWINIGIGGKQLKLKKKGQTIMDHWQRFVRRLKDDSLIKDLPGHPKGHTYYLFSGTGPTRLGNAFIAGDAAGLSTLDMGEGICAAVKSGIRTAETITGQGRDPKLAPSRFSLPGILFQK